MFAFKILSGLRGVGVEKREMPAAGGDVSGPGLQLARSLQRSLPAGEAAQRMLKHQLMAYICILVKYCN